MATQILQRLCWTAFACRILAVMDNVMELKMSMCVCKKKKHV